MPRTGRCYGLRRDHVEVGARAMCMGDWPHDEHEMPREDEPRVYAVRHVVAVAVNELIVSGRVPGLTSEEVIAGIAAEAALRAHLLDGAST